MKPRDRVGAVNWFLIAMKAKRPRVEEPDYPSLQEALYFLRKFSHLSLNDLAARLGLNGSTLSNIEAGVLYTGVSLETLENIKQAALECHLPKMAYFLDMLHIKLRRTPRKEKPKRLTLEDEIPVTRWGEENYRG